MVGLGTRREVPLAVLELRLWAVDETAVGGVGWDMVFGVCWCLFDDNK